MSDIDIELSLRKKIEKQFLSLCNCTHRNASEVFDHFLEYIVCGFQLEGRGLGGSWPYKGKENIFFYEMYKAWILAMKEILDVHAWYDFLGYLYETYVAGIRRKQGAGQFFTPKSVCDLMAAVVDTAGGETMSDPCCGSGRMLLASNAIHPGATLFATDLDRTCCLMTVCNLLVHGCRAKVTWGNSLTAEVREEWLVNPGLGNEFPFPHIVKLQEAA